MDMILNIKADVCARCKKILRDSILNIHNDVEVERLHFSCKFKLFNGRLVLIYSNVKFMERFLKELGRNHVFFGSENVRKPGDVVLYVPSFGEFVFIDTLFPTIFLARPENRKSIFGLFLRHNNIFDQEKVGKKIFDKNFQKNRIAVYNLLPIVDERLEVTRS